MDHSDGLLLAGRHAHTIQLPLSTLKHLTLPTYMVGNESAKMPGDPQQQSAPCRVARQELVAKAKVQSCRETCNC